MWTVFANFGSHSFELMGPFDTLAEAIRKANRRYAPALVRRFDVNHLKRNAWIYPITIEELP